MALLTRGKLATAQALVLDLRGGWGGASPEYLSLFAGPVISMTAIGRDGTVSEFPPRWSRPVALLVDETTRSGKEVFALGFRRAGFGPLVGSRTAGAVVAGRAFPVGERSLLYLAHADVRVAGQRLEGRGVDPDVDVESSVAYAAGRDAVLERALELMAESVRREAR